MFRFPYVGRAVCPPCLSLTLSVPSFLCHDGLSVFMKRHLSSQHLSFKSLHTSLLLIHVILCAVGVKPISICRWETFIDSFDPIPILTFLFYFKGIISVEILVFCFNHTRLFSILLICCYMFTSFIPCFPLPLKRLLQN